MTTMSPATSRARPEPAVPPDPRRWGVLALLAVAQLMLILDVTVVNVALPDIGSDLGLHRSVLPWVLTAYTLAFGGLMLLGGRAADAFGARRVLLTGLAAFVVASLTSGLATGAVALLAGRTAQGVGAALMSPAALSLVTTTFADGRERNRALGIWAAMAGAGSVLGVILGGLLTSGPGWRWIFFVNVPVGVLVAALLPLLVRQPVQAPRRGGVDIPGALSVTLATGAALYGLINAGTYGWRDGRTLVPLAVAVPLYLAFLAVESRAATPLMPPRVLRRRPVLAGVLLMLVATGLLVGGLFVGSFYLQRVRGFSAAATGLAFLPVALGTIIGAHLAGRVASRVDRRALAAAALAVAALGSGVAAWWRSPAGLVSGLGVAAVGIGAALVTAITAALAGVEPAGSGTRSGIVNTFHELGGALGVAVLSSVVAGALTAVHPATTGFTRAFAVSALAAAAGAVLAVPVVPAGTASAGAVPHGH